MNFKIKLLRFSGTYSLEDLERLLLNEDFVQFNEMAQDRKFYKLLLASVQDVEKVDRVVEILANVGLCQEVNEKIKHLYLQVYAKICQQYYVTINETFKELTRNIFNYFFENNINRNDDKEEEYDEILSTAIRNRCSNNFDDQYFLEFFLNLIFEQEDQSGRMKTWLFKNCLLFNHFQHHREIKFWSMKVYLTTLFRFRDTHATCADVNLRTHALLYCLENYPQFYMDCLEKDSLSRPLFTFLLGDDLMKTFELLLVKFEESSSFDERFLKKFLKRLEDQPELVNRFWQLIHRTSKVPRISKSFYYQLQD